MHLCKRIPLLALLLILVSTYILTMETTKLEEYKAKSIFLYRVCRFTTWPKETTWDPARPLVISVLGTSPSGNHISIANNKKIGKRRIEIKYIKDLNEIDRSDVLFISTSEEYRLDKILKYVSNKPILTVGDTPGYGRKGVILNIFIKDKTMGFEINPGALRKTDIRLHSYLFEVGVIVNTIASAKAERSSLEKSL